MVGDSLAIPTGTVTFLFSDVVGSTRLWATDEAAMAGSLRVHDAIVRTAAARRDGYVFTTAGDSFGVAFTRASAAAECAVAIQDELLEADWAGGLVLSVRIGMHLGEAEERDGNYFGTTLNIAARTMSAANAGQCLMTEAVRGAILASFVVLDLGLHQLRDVAAPLHLWQIGDAQFPHIWTIGAGNVSLPLPRTSLIGRADAVSHVRRLLAQHRLVTLTGVGGCGKTRLSIETAHQEVPSHPDGVWFVDLSTIADDDALFSTFALALSVQLNEPSSAFLELTTYLATRTALLVVDNCEHVIDEIADVIDSLLAACPDLRVLATSRESLEIDGEFTWKVPSLATDGAAPAVQLFKERGRSSGATFNDDDVTTALVSEIVERLDGMPLAIELAAARSRSMSLTEIRDRLDDRFRVLSGGKKRSRQRQATLEAAVQWSYDLLNADEQQGLQRLSVFQGGFDLADVAVVLEVDTWVAANVVDSLASKSLIDIGSDVRGNMRHRLLETIRLFGLARLVEASEAESVRDRHLDLFLGDPIGASMSAWLDIASLWRIDREYENFRAASLWAIERNRPDATVKIAAVIAEAAVPRGDIALVIDWLQLDAELPGPDRVFALALLAHCLNMLGRIPESQPVTEAAIEVGRELMCDSLVFALLDQGVLVGIAKGDTLSQLALYQEAAQISGKHFGPNLQALTMMFSIISLSSLQRYDEVIACAEDAFRIAPSFGYRHIVEAWHAFALLSTGREGEAVAAVENWSPVPPSSQWAAMNYGVECLVSASQIGPDQAARKFAPKAREMVARRPATAPDLLVVFGELARQLGDDALALQCMDFQCMSTWAIQWAHVRELKTIAAADDLNQFLVDYVRRLPIEQRMLNNATLVPALLADAISRWS